MKTFAAALAATTFLSTAAAGADLVRVATVPIGAEITGLFLHGDDLFMNVQHPSDALPNEFARAAVGVIANADYDAGPIDAPTAQADKEVVRSSLGDYQILFQEGSFGGRMASIAGAGGVIKVSNDPDFNAFVPTGGSEGYLFTNWEDRPGGMSRVKLARAADGTWTADPSDAKMLDFSPVGGTWVNCFGTLSPWGTPLTSEELYFDDTARWNDKSYKYIKGVEALANYKGAYPNPYDYGYIVEITDPAGAAAPVKRLVMGRFSHENAVIMPDRRTAYLSDDGTDVVFYKFVADEPGDLSSGTLYAAKATQRGEPGADSATTAFDIEWIELARGSDAQVAAWASEYDGITQDDFEEGGTNFVSDAEIAAWARGEAEDDRAAFLESRKAAKAKGATAEFRKMEGVNINHDNVADGSAPFMYVAMSEVSKGMSDKEGHVQVSFNPCGIVYEMELDEAFDVSRMVPAVAGGPHDGNDKANACAIDGIANPDNLVILDDGRVLIGEDTGKHENNALWIWTRPAS